MPRERSMTSREGSENERGGGEGSQIPGLHAAAPGGGGWILSYELPTPPLRRSRTTRNASKSLFLPSRTLRAPPLEAGPSSLAAWAAGFLGSSSLGDVKASGSPCPGSTMGEHPPPLPLPTSAPPHCPPHFLQALSPYPGRRGAGGAPGTLLGGAQQHP